MALLLPLPSYSPATESWQSYVAHFKCYLKNRCSPRFPSPDTTGGGDSEFLAALRKAAYHCEFRDLDDALLDRIVCGVRDEKLQCRFLAKSDLTLKQAIEEAQAMEAAKHSTAEICKAYSPTIPKKPTTVYHEEISKSESCSDNEDDVCRIKQKRGIVKQ
ncbi:Hypothetical predicted protein [Podarcis lilfordi]|uniref:Uncharacterized protein n=1 Tax=Podarcis lilfordi TaxID=74358 RepID=A0AA35LN82_9SAUR|nr:Hypothetical predicted protein [Podarcis lilfordi]